MCRENNKTLENIGSSVEDNWHSAGEQNVSFETWGTHTNPPALCLAFAAPNLLGLLLRARSTTLP